MGSERKSRYIPPKTLKTSAYVEAGRALIALKTSGAVPLHKVSIMPRGNMLSSVSVLIPLFQGYLAPADERAICSLLRRPSSLVSIRTLYHIKNTSPGVSLITLLRASSV